VERGEGGAEGRKRKREGGAEYHARDNDSVDTTCTPQKFAMEVKRRLRGGERWEMIVCFSFSTFGTGENQKRRREEKNPVPAEGEVGEAVKLSLLLSFGKKWRKGKKTAGEGLERAGAFQKRKEEPNRKNA